MKEGRSLETLSIVIPVFNEVNTVNGIIERVQEVQLHRIASREIVIVDDDCTENGRNSQEITHHLQQVNH
jgi:glycosyltransferase involved in cell wall biosynthesis